MKGQFLYLNIMFILAIVSLHLPMWFNGKFASFLAIIYTIVSDNLGLDINTITIIGFLVPLYVFYYIIFFRIDSNVIKVIFSVILILTLLPFGAMLPPR